MDTVLAVLPFADVDRPAIGVSLLQAALKAEGLECAVQYLNFDLAESIGVPLYTAITESLPSESLVGEWFFADTVFGDAIPSEHEYITRVLSRHADAGLIDQIQAARRERARFIESAVECIAALRPRIVGFTTTFHQTCCCLAVARRLKDLANPPLIIFGGANCEGEMGVQLLRSFPWIDAVCTREGDVAFPCFVRRFLAGDASPVDGIVRRGAGSELTLPDLVRELDQLPVPDYGDYFARLARVPPHVTIRPELLIESSRGCWWGAKHHCVFCGLNGDTMKYRSKSPERVYAELTELHRRYGVRKIDFVDNILDLRYLDTVLPRLEASGLDLELFFEVKANLRRPQVEALRAGGVRTIQPGIESFSTPVLQLMNKGCTGCQNLQLLRWCEENGITVAWNILAGFPGEDPAEYDRMADLIPLLAHLQPPASCSPIRLDRFSPLFTQQTRFGLRGVRPTASYYYVYPLGRKDLSRLAYFFDFEYPDDRKPHTYLRPVRVAVEAWLLGRSGEPDSVPRLDATRLPDGSVNVHDTRACAVRRSHGLSGLAATLYLECDVAHAIGALELLAVRSGYEPAEVVPVLEDLIENRLMVSMDGRYLSLAVWRCRVCPSSEDTPDAHAAVQEADAAEPVLHPV